jgi:steroid delta-isomerase-like uncharacterized protein
MSAEANKEAVQRYFAAIDAQDFATLGAMFAPSYRAHIGGNPEDLDVAGMQAFAGAFFAGLSDLRHEITKQVAEGDSVATVLSISGTHSGELMGVPPSGRRLVFPAINLHRFENGQIVEHWIQFDSLGVLAQLGAAPAMA